MPGSSSAAEKDRRLKEVQIPREQLIEQRRNVVKKAVYLAGAGALGALTAGMLGSFLPPQSGQPGSAYGPPSTVSGTYPVEFAESGATSAWSNDRIGQPMLATDFPSIGLAAQGQVKTPLATINVVVAFLDPRFISNTMAGTVDFGNGAFAAYNAKCKHLGCVALWRNADEAQKENGLHWDHDLIVCPCHKGTYDIYDSARVRFGPPPDPLDQLKLVLEGDAIQIEFSAYKWKKNRTGGQVEGNPFTV